VQPILQHYLKESNRILAHTSAIWSQQRQMALEHFFQKGFPSTKDENWRYISRSPILQQPFKIGGAPTLDAVAADSLPLPALNQSDALRLICLNGRFYLPSQMALPDGLQIEPIHQVMQDHPESLIHDRFKEMMQLGHSFSAINTVFSQEGLMISIRDGCVIEPVIEVWYVSYNLPLPEPMLFCMRNDVRVGEKSAVKIIEYAMMLDEDARLERMPSVCTNTLTTLTLEASAEVQWGQSIHIEDHHSHIGQLAVQQKQNSALHAESLVFGGGLVRHTLAVDLCETSATCALHGFSAAQREHVVDHQIALHHQADHTKSHIHYRAIANDRGRASFGGEITAKSGIRQMSSHQGNYNLLLSDQAEIDTRPRLALFAGDIQCTHGATVGALDADALFYLQSRGLLGEVARLMLIQAFSQVFWQTQSILLASRILPATFEEFIKGHH
jgi:Fe-S cluster assembly protein SufD